MQATESRESDPTQNQRNPRNPPSESPNPHGANRPGDFPEQNLRSDPRSLRFNPVTYSEPQRQPLRLCPHSQEPLLGDDLSPRSFSPWEMTMDKQKTGLAIHICYESS
ncbi:hypothetical protein F2Q69_00048710 [Brassica cretica]|uniref:Uncharacterized protein n=1 Tax=Brassica cretica TaxID=69181 RepID=A0A8S9Q0Y9_BRACR|nr:hypothetical protein F2Q69_00048710 [Brassica cretica]